MGCALHFGESFLTPVLRALLPVGSSCVLSGKRGKSGLAGHPSWCPWGPLSWAAVTAQLCQHSGAADLRSGLISGAAKFINNRSRGGS